MNMNTTTTSRRQFLAAAAAASVAMGLGLPAALAAEGAAAPPPLKGKADHCVFVWLGGGMSQVDTFDPKRRGDPKAKVAGSYYDAVDTAVPGVRVCEHLARLAPLMDRVTAVRTVNHDVIDEHAAAVNRMHTGRIVSGTVQYPSIGSVVAHERGPASDAAPPYVLIGYPNVTRGPGFLGSKAGYLYLTDTSQGPAGLSRPPGLSDARQSRREALLAGLRSDVAAAAPAEAADPRVRDYAAAIDQSLKLSGPGFNRAFDLAAEPAALRRSYGGEFGQRCLLARRLVEQGVRFIEVSHNLNFTNGTGWDAHNSGILKQHELIRDLDAAVSTLIVDLEAKKLLDRTLIVVATEFGRPPEFDGGGGRGHQGKAFTCVLAGGGLRHRGAFGTTDDLGKKPAADAVSVPDLFATMHAALGIDYTKSLHEGDRPVPITDGGKPIAALFG
jgi:uncharacterized protein (DUF1501 family)